MGRITMETAKTVLEVAEVAFKAAEFSHEHHPHLPRNNEHQQKSDDDNQKKQVKEKELEALRLENQRLRGLLEQNLKLLQNISESPCLLEDCPPDLHSRIMDTVESPKFLSQLKTLHNNSVDGIPCRFSLNDASGMDLELDEILINFGLEEPSLWIWVSDEMVHGNVEEKSGIDNENYVVISQEQVVDGIANFMARCILLNPKAKNLAPEEMQKTLAKALGGKSKFEKILDIWQAGEMFYLMATWGLALAGLYQSRAVLRVAARGVHATSKVAMRAF
ncbi:uncharacterized protein LOC112528301 [Cynara cardunculus var. scolymus]|uniref:Uncharacterized protein n=1 Tax=Cynara cardunculus var. scolymus TaxID=59895 RepID=A0A118K587_CYNCS|nr:uncharacterized protein LOC112528301 [Cynara cardunculus var. scolymus]KVI08688.1 hypothetical protein Ccrd_012933 [Cynara cardunculus var. scolymus]